MYVTFFQCFILEVYLALAISEVGSKSRYDWPQFSIFQYFHFIILRNGELWLGKSALVCWLSVFFILVVLINLKKDNNICLVILMKLSLRFRVSKIYKFLLVQVEFNEINSLVLKSSRTDNKFIHVGDLRYMI